MNLCALENSTRETSETKPDSALRNRNGRSRSNHFCQACFFHPEGYLSLSTLCQIITSNLACTRIPKACEHNNPLILKCKNSGCFVLSERLQQPEIEFTSSLGLGLGRIPAIAKLSLPCPSWARGLHPLSECRRYEPEKMREKLRLFVSISFTFKFPVCQKDLGQDVSTENFYSGTCSRLPSASPGLLLHFHHLSSKVSTPHISLVDRINMASSILSAVTYIFTTHAPQTLSIYHEFALLP